MDVALSSAWHNCKSDGVLDICVNKSRGFSINLVRNKWTGLGYRIGPATTNRMTNSDMRTIIPPSTHQRDRLSNGLGTDGSTKCLKIIDRN